jgi:hypothetical protein
MSGVVEVGMLEDRAMLASDGSMFIITRWISLAVVDSLVVIPDSLVVVDILIVVDRFLYCYRLVVSFTIKQEK